MPRQYVGSLGVLVGTFQRPDQGVSKDVVWCRFEDNEGAIEELFPVPEEKN